MIRSLFSLVVIFGPAVSCPAQVPALAVLQQGKPTSLRGLSVVDDSVAWVSGSGGWVGRTADRGETWRWAQVTGHEHLDFRDIEAFSAGEAVIISAGTPLVILRTTDGGQAWTATHRDGRPEIFMDGMDFWDDGRGLAYGDPIAGVMQLLATDDWGLTWRDVSGEANLGLAEGEAGFAASGTGIRTLPGGGVYIATGGKVSRVFHSADRGATWAVYGCPIVQGSSSTGIFSVAFRDALHGVVVGGDYREDGNAADAAFLTSDGGKTWWPPTRGTRGYRSGVEYIGDRWLLATGTSGVDLSRDGGRHWEALSADGYHAVRKAKKGSWVLLAGSDGRIATLVHR